MLKAVLFDCDGVLLDSESIYLSCLSRVLGSLGKKASVKELAYLVGADIHIITNRLKMDFGLEDWNSNELIRLQRELFHKEFYGHRLNQMEGLEDCLKKMKKEGILLAVVSSSDRIYVEYVLDHLEIRKYFDFFIGREDARRSKPFPDLYLEAVRKLGVLPGQAAVIEDSSNGIRAGLDAGCYVIAYKGAEVRQDTSGACETVESYRDLNIKGLEKGMKDWSGQ